MPSRHLLGLPDDEFVKPDLGGFDARLVAHPLDQGTTMKAYPLAKQRAALLKLISALGCREAALRRDECGDWRIEGSNGHAYAVPGTLDRPNRPGFMLYVMTGSQKAWTFAKRALVLAEVVNDGDEEGAFVMYRLPSADEAGLIRRYCGITKRREVSEAELNRLRSVGFASRRAA
jgi:hypothetical protein